MPRGKSNADTEAAAVAERDTRLREEAIANTTLANEIEVRGSLARQAQNYVEPADHVHDETAPGGRYRAANGTWVNAYGDPVEGPEDDETAEEMEQPFAPLPEAGPGPMGATMGDVGA